MTYADYTFYVTEYHGTGIGEDEFPRLSCRASDYLEYITMGKSKTYNDVDQKLAKACCAIAERMDAIEKIVANAGDGEIASESVGPHSVSYRSGADMSAFVKSECLNVARMYLAGTWLLYRGIGYVHSSHRHCL